MIHNFKKLTLFSAILLLFLTGCSKDLEAFTGSWHCAETPLENTDFYSGYLTLEIQENGDFSMYDQEAGNPGIAGNLVIKSDHQMTLNCTDKTEFDRYLKYI